MKKIILAVFMLSFALTGCNKPETPESVVTKFFGALSATNYDEVNNYTDSPFFKALSDEEIELYNKYFPSISIANPRLVKKDSSMATVAADITGMDVNAILQKLIMDAIAQMEQNPQMNPDELMQEMDAKFLSMLESPDAPVKTITAELDLVLLKKDGKKRWALVTGPGLSSAVFLENPDEAMPMTQGEPEMEVVDTITEKATYLGSDKIAEMCGFKIGEELIYMYCDPEQIADLEANYLNKELEVTFDVLSDVAGMSPSVFVLVSHK